uniref:G_PROTEIN_RECEP_F1_2 domain-containing protein n=1 Tax=Ascaris lumbricoides TaxID=6252 RepID=A0A0M3IJQ1_ASCLU
MDSQHLMASAILLIVCIGVLGNLVSLFMFSRPHMRTASVNVLLSALSAVDLGLLVLSIPVFVVPGLDPCNEVLLEMHQHDRGSDATQIEVMIIKIFVSWAVAITDEVHSQPWDSRNIVASDGTMLNEVPATLTVRRRRSQIEITTQRLPIPLSLCF